jgi:hypothetical protein
MPPERGGVLGGAVALVQREAVLRPGLVQLGHDPVPGDLRHHARRRHARGDPVALPYGEAGDVEAVDREAVGQHVLGAHGERGERAPHPGEVAHVQAAAVDLAGRDHHHGVVQRLAQHPLVDPLPRGGAEQLRVGQLRDLAGPAGGQHDRGDHQRPGAGAATGLVGAGDRAEAAPVQVRSSA